MTNDNQETRSYNEILEENKQLKKTIADYERAYAVAEALVKNNDVLSSTESKTYQVRSDEVDVEFGRFMFEWGQLHSAWRYTDADATIDAAIEVWKTNKNMI